MTYIEFYVSLIGNFGKFLLKCLFCASFFEDCSLHYGHKGNPKMTFGTCGSMGEEM